MALTDDPSGFVQSVGPKRAMVDGDIVESHPLSEVIALDKYLKKNSSGPSLLKIRRAKFVQPGHTSRFDAPECQ